MLLTNEDELPLDALKTVMVVPHGTWWVLSGFVGLEDGKRLLWLAPVVSYDAEFNEGVGQHDGLDHDARITSNSVGMVHLYGPLTAFKVAAAMQQLPRRSREGLSASDMGPWTLEDFDYWSLVTLHAEGIITDDDVRELGLGDELSLPRRAAANVP